MDTSRRVLDKTYVTVRLEYDPEDITEKTGNMLGVVSRRVNGDLGRFKDFIESRGHETSSWHGTIKRW